MTQFVRSRPTVRWKASGFPRASAKQRNRIERMFGHLKINRAIATRYDLLANSFLGMVISAPPDTVSNLSTPPSGIKEATKLVQ